VLEISQRIVGLLDLGAGFHADLTGRENVFVNGVIIGLTRREVAQQFDSIVAFAELQSFIDNPIRTYSTGMQMRLGFSIAIHASPEMLLIDEILSVGDHSFQQKCLDRINRFKSEGCTILLVSHDCANPMGKFHTHLIHYRFTVRPLNPVSLPSCLTGLLKTLFCLVEFISAGMNTKHRYNRSHSIQGDNDFHRCSDCELQYM
jgi:hypothetical protein